MLISMALCFALTISVAVSIGLSALVGMHLSDAHMLISVKEMFNSLNKFPLAAIPFFILAGNIMETGGISRRLVEFAKSIVGGVQGGLPMTCVLTCMIFAAVSGSSVATNFAIGAVLIPALIKHGYPTPYAAALQATAAELGVIIPPSIPMILYGESAEVSIGEMFIAGIGPGSSAVVMFIIANAGMFAYLITRAGVPDAIGRWLVDALRSPFYFLLGVNAALFVIGMFIETSASIIVLAPILAPVAVHFGIDPIHFGLIMVVNLALGMITPPFGVNLFAASTVARISVHRIVRDLLPFVPVVLACLMVISYVPVLSLGLRDLVYNR